MSLDHAGDLQSSGRNNIWDDLYSERPVKILYIAGQGFDVRVKTVMEEFLGNIDSTKNTIEDAKLLLVGITGYQLSDELRRTTESNSRALRDLFTKFGTVEEVNINSSVAGEEDATASMMLRLGMTEVIRHLDGYTDVVLDVSSMPRMVYLSLLMGILDKYIPDTLSGNALSSSNVNFQVLVAEDPVLDGQIKSEELSNDLITIPGFSSALHSESLQEWPLVWFPVLGENRTAQFQKVLDLCIPNTAEICPVVPHPSKDPRRADKLLVEYQSPLFDARETPSSNILYAHENHPFEAYRQLLSAMDRFKESMAILGGCRLVVTPLASKLITLGAGLACFEMRADESKNNHRVAIPYAEPTKYEVSLDDLQNTRPVISSLLLTGKAYSGAL